jgi:ABC-3C biological conflict system middle component
MAKRSHWALTWRERPPEEAAHFNPAFCGELLARTVYEYHRLRGAPLPLPLAFLVLPLTLHLATRRALPRKANATFASWSAEHEAILVGVPDRVLRLRPVTREGLLFLLQLGAAIVGADGVSPGEKPLRLSTKPPFSTAEVNEVRRTAGLLGRWFSHQPAPTAVLQTMGVRV